MSDDEEVARSLSAPETRAGVDLALAPDGVTFCRRAESKLAVVQKAENQRTH